MAFVGSVQLEKFNATIYVADLVSLAMVREMGALMVAIVMAGRTGAAFAAELGSMKIREELDSLRTFGIPAMEFSAPSNHSPICYDTIINSIRRCCRYSWWTDGGDPSNGLFIPPLF